jgi:hypothetical protein
MKTHAVVAVSVSLALLAGCSHVSIGVGLPIGRMGGIFVGGTVPVTPPAPAASAASAPTAATASAPAK